MLSNNSRKSRLQRKESWWRIFFILASFFLIFFIVLFIALLSHDSKETPHYDHIVIGGGPAGCVVAERLSRSGQHSVLLIEAGPDVQDDPILNIISPATGGIEGTYYGKYFWQHAQDAAEVIPNRLSLQLTTGRLMGGGSKINGAQYVRGTDWIWEYIASLTGDSIWSLSNVLFYFKELETYWGSNFDSSVRGDQGPLNIWQSPTNAGSMAEKLVTAYEQMTGLPRLYDYNNLSSAARVGPFLRWQLTSYPNATRSSSDVSILTPEVRARPNLHISTSSTAMHVLFNANKHAYGVRYHHNGRQHIVHARKRVVLSAGVNSPTLLEHSGVGNATHLSSLGIHVVKDNPAVGEHMFNQQLVSAVFLKNVSDTPSVNPADIYEGGAFLPNPIEDEVPNLSPRRIQIIGVNAGSVMVLVAINLQPIQEGYTHVRDKDPLRVSASSDAIFAPPNGNLDLANYVATVQSYICGIHNEFNGLGEGPTIDTSYTLIDPPLSYCSNVTLLTQWVISKVTAHTHHWTSACRMGPLDDGTSVVNSKGSVWGTTGLSIVDDSILPINHDGNTVAPAYLVAKIISEEIVNENF